jgi:hypothetical protein
MLNDATIKKDKNQKSIFYQPVLHSLFAYNNPSEFGAINCGYLDPKLMNLVDVRLGSLFLNRDLTHLFPNRFKKVRIMSILCFLEVQ